MASSAVRHKSREEMKRAKELEEARKAGLAPAEIDAQTGQAINPHIPQYMTTAPWYLNQDKPSLQHQKNWKTSLQQVDEKWYSRGARGKANRKFKAGACENCGATTHKSKDCLERPRKKLAKHTNEDLARDDVIEDIAFKDWAHKRDQYKGYNPDDYKEVMERYERITNARQEVLRKEQAEARYAEEDATDKNGDTDRIVDEDKLQDEQQAEFSKVDKRVRTEGGGATGSVRNLRLREDTAKYLHNLNPNSAHYDPKSRSMRADPLPDKAPHEKTFAGDNATRGTGDFEYWRQLTEHSVLEGEKGSSMHVQAAPTQALLAHAAFKEKKAKLASRSKQNVLDKYGNAAAGKVDEDLLLPSSEVYVEYDRKGQVIKGQEAVVRSRYDEDVFPGNHSSVWGSYWADGRWGYACCKSHLKNSLCMGDRVEQVAQQRQQNRDTAQDKEAVRDELADAKSDDAAKGSSDAGNRLASGNAGTTWGMEGDKDVELDESKVQAALQKLREQDSAAAAGEASGSGYHGLAGDSTSVTAEDMEAYRRHRSRVDDPMQRMAAAGGTGADGYDMV